MQSYEAVYDHGRLRWLAETPAIETARVIVTVLESAPVQASMPPSRLKDSVKNCDDMLSSALDPAEWERSLERTAQQIAGNEAAFKAE